jgi:two-component system, LytTR family, response regulator
MENEKHFVINRKVKIDFNQIILMKGNGNYSSFLLINGKSILVPKTLKQLELNLLTKKYFHRTHKAYLVNMSHIIDIEEYKLTMANNLTALISRRKKIGLYETYNRFIAK